MKLKRSIVLALSALFLASPAFASPVTYRLTLTNAGQLHFSPPVVYVLNGQTPLSGVSKKATKGFVEICQMGATQTRVAELSGNRAVATTKVLPGLAAGQSTQIEITVSNPMTQSIQIESMYGETKDVCAVASIGSHALYALKTQVTPEYLTKDDVVETGFFIRPSVMNAGYATGNACPNSMDAVACLRELSVPAAMPSTIRFFAPYLPSVLAHIETRFGSEATEKLNLPSSGALRIKAEMIH